MRTSNTAHFLRSLDFAYDEQEFREVFRIVAAQGDNATTISPASLDSIEASLGQARFEAFYKTRDPLFGMLQAASRHFGFSTSQVDEAYRVVSEGERRLRDIDRRGPILSVEQKAARRDLLAQQSRDLERILGADAARALTMSLSNFRNVGNGVRIVGQ